MFTIFTKEDNGFDVLVLSDDAAQTSVEIIPACGAILHAFNIKKEAGVLNIIDSYNSKKEFETSVEEQGFKSCKLSPFVCRLKNGQYHFGEKDYSIEKFYLGKHALHGLLYDAEYDIIQLNATTSSARAELLFAYQRTDKGFPFKYDCRIIYELAGDNVLDITTIIKNKENHAIPMADGWHPYFTFGRSVNNLELAFKSKERIEFDDDLIPTTKLTPYKEFGLLRRIGETVLDNGFIVDSSGEGPTVILCDPEKMLQLEITAGKSYPVLQIYTPGHRQSIAIENLSAAPDAFNNGIGLTVLQAGGEAVFKTSYCVRAMD